MRRYCQLLLALALAGCTTLMGPPLILGSSTLPDVQSRHGQPAMKWQDSAGGWLHAYPTGPSGTSTIMAQFDKQQRLQRYEEVLDAEHFALLKPGMSMDEVQRIIGPPYQPWTVYYKARDELVWEWRYCDAWSEAARFNVLFDGTSKRLRSTLSLNESQLPGRRSPSGCGRSYLHLEKGPTQSSPAMLPSGNSTSVKPN